jgi:hypothetical protein
LFKISVFGQTTPEIPGTPEGTVSGTKLPSPADQSVPSSPGAASQGMNGFSGAYGIQYDTNPQTPINSNIKVTNPNGSSVQSSDLTNSQLQDIYNQVIQNLYSTAPPAPSNSGGGFSGVSWSSGGGSSGGGTSTSSCPNP